jgi:hypothetical protein
MGRLVVNGILIEKKKLELRRNLIDIILDIAICASVEFTIFDSRLDMKNKYDYLIIQVSGDPLKPLTITVSALCGPTD